MRFTEYLTEATNKYGIVISKTTSGRFDDLDLYDMTNDKPMAGRGHAQDLFDAFVSGIKENNGWHDVEHFIKKRVSGKKLGEDYSDDENFVNTLYGPFTINQLGRLSDDFEEEYDDINEAADSRKYGKSFGGKDTAQAEDIVSKYRRGKLSFSKARTNLRNTNNAFYMYELLNALDNKRKARVED